MADINQVITLGIGTPSDIGHFILFGLGDLSGGDVTAPTASGWASNVDGDAITATLSESGCIPTNGTGGFTLGGTSATVASWAISSTTLTLTLSGVISPGETVTVSYDDASTTDDITDASSNKLADIAGASVTNNTESGGLGGFSVFGDSVIS